MTGVQTCALPIFIPLDNTIPQNSEGTELATLTITPQRSTSILEIEFRAYSLGSSPGPTLSIALFQDSSANAIASSAEKIENAQKCNHTLSYRMEAGTTSATTFKIRAGPDANNSTLISPLFGGVGSSYFRIREILK